MRAKCSKASSRRQEDVQSQFRVLQNDSKDSKSELQGTSNSITPNPLFIQASKNPITVLRSAAEAKPINYIKCYKMPCSVPLKSHSSVGSTAASNKPKKTWGRIGNVLYVLQPKYLQRYPIIYMYSIL